MPQPRDYREGAAETIEEGEAGKMKKDAEPAEAVDRAKERYKSMRDSLSKAHEVGRLCMDFVAGKQWSDDERADREETNRPIITINRMANPVNIVINKNAMEAARIKVAPFEDSDVDKSKVINGLIRHIQFSDKSDAVEAYSWAFFCLAVCGFGYWRVDAEYINDKEFDQELVINKLDDPFAVYLDPDGCFAIVLKSVRKTVFKEKYDRDGSTEFGDAEWEPDNDDDVLLVEYWEKTETPVDLYRVEVPETIAAGQDMAMDIDAAIEASTARSPQVTAQAARIITLTKEELDAKDEFGAPVYPEYAVLKKRKSKKTEIKQYLFSGDEEIEVNDWPGIYIPIVGVFSRKFKTSGGDYFFKPLVYDSIDPQRLYNFYRSQDAELMLQIPKAVWVGAEEQFDGHEEEYDNAHKTATSRLEYKPVLKDGVLLPPPQRMPPPAASQGYYQNISTAAEEIKATTGIFDPSLGAPSNEVSGKAILARRQQGDIGSFHFTIAINGGLRATGLILVDQIPYRYDAPRTVRILGEDMTDEVVRINQSFVDKDGTPRLYDLTTGNYDVKIETGSNSITRRADAAENLLEFARVVPNAAAVAADMIVSNFDFEKADELALRLKAALPPQLLERVKQLEMGDEGAVSQQQQREMAIQQQMSKMMQALQSMAKENQLLKGKITNDKLTVEQLKVMGGIREEQIRAAADIVKARIQSQSGFNAIPRGAGLEGIR